MIEVWRAVLIVLAFASFQYNIVVDNKVIYPTFIGIVLLFVAIAKL
jgi:hypothetical protein